MPSLHILEPEHLALIRDALDSMNKGVEGLDGQVVAARKALDAMPGITEIVDVIGEDNTNSYVAAARGRALNREVRIERKTVVAPSDNGAFVMCWVYVNREDAWGGPTHGD